MPQTQALIFSAAIIATWEKELAHLPETLAQHETTNNFAGQKTELEKNITEGKLFLDTLRNNPKKMVLDVAISLDEQLDQFDCQFSCKQSIALRRYINKIRLSLKEILEENIENDNRHWQEAYQKIHGLLSTLYYDGLNHSEKDVMEKAFFALINNTLQRTHMAVNSDLPDEMKVGQLSCHYFKERCQQFTDAALDTHEKKEFERRFSFTLQRFYAMKIKNKEQSKCRAYGFLLLDDIDNEKILAEKNNRPFDVKYATTVLKKTNQLLDHPLNPKIHAQCKTLANHDKGAPSLAVKIGSAFVALLGVIIALGSALLIPTSFGASGIGIPIGTSLIAQGTAIGLGITGVTSFGAGLTLFGKGERRGLSKSLVELAKATNIASTPKPVVTQHQHEQEIASIPPWLGWVR